MNVLSLFDGMSCGQLALVDAGIKYDKYFACEIKKHAIKVTQHNFPNTIQLGDVRNVTAKDLPKIDLLIGGSPCQDFSLANSERKGLEGKKSSLFWEYVRILKEVKPKYFLLENVAMPKKDYETLSQILGTYPVNINSERVSAQLRNRFYWTNIGAESFDLFGNRYCEIPQPKYEKIKLQDILEYGYTERVKSRCLLEGDSRPHSTPSKMAKRYFNSGFTTLIFKDEKTYLRVKEATKIGNIESFKFQYGDIRYFTKTELERLQTVPEGYTSILSRNKAACLLGDGWTIKVISHIFKQITQ